MSGIHAQFRLDWPGFTLDVDLQLPATGVTALFGHSGSGKTTLLRCMAGLERAPQGRLTINGDVWQGCDPLVADLQKDHWVMSFRRPACSPIFR